MKQFILTPLTATGKVAKSIKTTISFADSDRHFSIVVLENGVQVTSKKGCYLLTKHQHMDEYHANVQGTNGKVVHLRFRNTTVPKFWYY